MAIAWSRMPSLCWSIMAELLEAMAAGHTVVTSTRRLARSLQAGFDRSMSAAGWATPLVLPWSAWIQASFRDLRDFGVLGAARPCLDEWQAAALWEEVFAGDRAAESLLAPSSAVEGLREAWALVHDWRLPWKAIEARAGADCQAWLRVAASYRKRLDALGLIDTGQLPALLADALAQGSGPEVWFAGFDFLTPAQEHLARALGPRARQVAVSHRGALPSVAGFADSRHELAAAAAWARTRLEENPAARLGIVVPDLESQAPLLERLLDEALVPARLLPGHSGAPRPWNLSLGRTLADAPVVASAFLAFGLARDRLEFAAMSRLLRSPFLGGAAEEGSQRASFETWSRTVGGESFDPVELLAWLGGRDRAPACPRLAGGLRRCLDEWRNAPRQRRPSAWAAALTRGLGHLGWPGETVLDSAGWQTVKAWTEALEGFSRLDAVVGPLGFEDALARLYRLCAGQRFQPETPELPVQALGLFETAGLEFDALWVTGMHDGVLPSPLRPSPWLPAAVQREHGLPRACPDTERVRARRLVERLAGAAEEVRFSYPMARGDEPLRASPVLAGMPPWEAPPVARAGVASACFATRRIESLAEVAAPPITGKVRGGSGLLAAQSACPFKAFAVHRLHAEAIETPGTGVDARTRGTVLHHALSELWRTLEDRTGLATLDGAARRQLVQAALEQAAREHLARLPPGLVQIELAEAGRTIQELLGLELSRPDFAVIEREQCVDMELGPLRITGRVDRVDRVAGGVVVIDYKSGAASAAKWRGERPEEPQMPLYALAFRAELAALVYASLKPGSVGFKGIARSAEALGDVLPAREVAAEEAWDETLAAWQRVLEGMARAHAAGDASVDPARGPGMNGACAYCHLATLCRRDELMRSGVIGDG
jgi:ATP-dependent helicase/nuclease subunit B